MMTSGKTEGEKERVLNFAREQEKLEKASVVIRKWVTAEMLIYHRC